MFGEVIILEQIIEYIKRNYNPISVILYGSYADGTNNLNSDFVQIFDGKIIVDSNERGKALQMKVISHILGNLITVIFDYQILRKPLKILSL